MKFTYKLPENSFAANNTDSEIDIEGANDLDHIVTTINQTRTFYEIDLLEHIAATVPKGGVYIDVGANIGNHSVFLGKFLADHLVAIEANQAMIPFLKRNLEANQVKSYLVLPIAVGATESTGQLVYPDNAVNNFGAAQVRTNDGTADTGESIAIVPLDQAIELGGIGDRPITFMKIDIEGMEFDALRGAEAILEKHHPQLAVELLTQEVFADVSAFLNKLGYVNVGRFCWSPTYHFINPTYHQFRQDAAKEKQEAHKNLVLDELSRLIADDPKFIFVDEEQLRYSLNVFPQAIPFTERNGEYNGPPADNDHAILEIERQIEAGATAIVFIWTSFWMLNYYNKMHNYLEAQHECILRNERIIAYSLKK